MGRVTCVWAGVAAAWAALACASALSAQTTLPTGDPVEAWRTEFGPTDPRATDTKEPSPIAGSADPSVLATPGVMGSIVPNETRVLLLHSHGPDDTYTLVQTQGFHEALKQRAPGPITPFREFLFMSLRGEDEGYRRALADLLAIRYRGVRFSIVMITDTRAMRFWLEHMRHVLPGVPAVFSGSYQRFPEFEAPDRALTGSMETVDLVGTIDLIRSLRPGTRHVAVMLAPSAFGRRMRAAFDEQLASRGDLGIRVTIYMPSDWEHILEPFQGEERADAMIYVAGPIGLTPGKHLFPPQWIQSQVPGGVPVFALFDAALGPEVIGGLVSSGRRMGRIAGEAAARILYDGVKPSDIPIDPGTGALVPMFRWEMLDKWGISESSLPPGSVVIGRPESWAARHSTGLLRAAAVIGISAAGAMGAVVWGLVAARRRRARAESALVESERRLQHAVGGANLGIWEVDLATGVVTGSDLFWDLYGMPRGSRLLRSEGVERLHPEDREAVGAAWEQCVQGRDAYRVTYRFRRPSGEYRWFKVDGGLVRDHAGRAWKVVGVSADITEKMESRRELEQSERKLSELIRHAPLGVIEWDGQWRCVRWDGRAESMFGWKPEEVLGKSFSEWSFVFEGDADAVAAAIRTQDSERPTTFASTNRNYTKDGRVLACEWTNTNIYDASGRRVRTLSMVADVTAQREAERALRESEERYRLVARAATDIMWDWDIASDQVRWSDAAKGLPKGAGPSQGLSIAEWIDHLHVDDRERVRAGFFGAVNNPARETWSDEYRMRLDDGTFGVFADRGFIVRDSNGKATRMVGAMTDVTEARAMTEKIRENEQRLRLALEATGMGTWDADLSARRIRHSERSGQICGVPPDRLESPWDDRIARIHPDDRGLVQRAVEEAARTGARYDATYRLLMPDGTYRWISAQAVVFSGADGKASRAIGVLADVTERTEAQETLRRSEERFREIAENIPQVFWVSDPGESGVMRYVSRAARDVFGVNAADLDGTGLGWAHLIHPEDASRAEHTRRAWYRSGCAGNYDNLYRIIRPDGEVRHIHNRGYAVRDTDGRIVRVTGLAEDITERENARLRLAESERRFREMAENIDQVFWVRTVSTNEIVYVSPATRRLWGFEPAALLGSVERWRGLIHPDDRDNARESTTRWISGGCKGQHVGEYRIVTADGSERWVSSRAKAIEGPDGAPARIVGVTEDITDRVRAKLELERSLATQRLLLSELDHRVKNNLAGLLALIELNAARQPSVRGFAEAIQRRVSSMASLHALLSASRWEPVDLARLMNGLIPSDAPGSISIQGPPCAVPASRATAMGMVLHELLSNSVKYGALGAVGGHVRVDWTTRRSDEGLWLDLRWVEWGGPAIETPPAPGLGTSLIDGFARFELRGKATLTYPRGGASYRLEACLVDEQTPTEAPRADADHLVGSTAHGKASPDPGRATASAVP